MGLLEPLNTRISLEMTGDTKLYMVSAKQGDKATRYVVAELSNNGERYSIPQGAYAVVNIIKPDGKKVYNDCVYNESEVIFELTNQILAAAGTAYCDIQIRTKDEEQILTSATFTIEIEKTMRDDSAILSSDEFTFFEKSMQKVKEITESLDNAKINFVEAKERENINTEDTFGVILGKLEKIVGDLKEVAFSGEYKDITGTPKKLGDFENDAGYVTTDTDTWKANTAESEGYVPATGGMANRIYGTDDEGNPMWKEGFDIDIDIKPDFTGTLDELYAAMEDGSAPVDTIAFVENDTEFEADDFLLPEDRVLVTGPDGVYPSETTAQELEYLSGVTGNVQEQIDDLSSITQKITISPTLDWASSANIELTKLGKLVQILIEVNNVTLPSTNNIITKIPEEYLPLGYTYIPLISQIESFGSYYYIDLSGNIRLFANNGSGVTRWLTASWIYIAK